MVSAAARKTSAPKVSTAILANLRRLSSASFSDVGPQRSSRRFTIARYWTATSVVPGERFSIHLSRSVMIALERKW